MRPLGKLEERLMSLMWDGERRTVRDVVGRLDDELAYTTVMTTLDRLFKKGLLARAKSGAAFTYRSRMSRDQYHQALVEEQIGGLLEQSTGPVLAAFVDTAARLDERNLRRLEQLIAKRRAKNKS